MIEKGSETIRLLSSSELDAAAELWLGCFKEDTREFVDYYFSRRTAPEKMLGLFISCGGREELVSMLCFEEHEMRLENYKTARVAFVAGVCTREDMRRRGYVRALMAALEELLENSGVSALMLQPFSFAFYEKLGFFSYAEREHLVPTEQNDDVLNESFNESLTLEFFSNVYESYTRLIPGSLKRNAAQSEALLEEYTLGAGNALCVGTPECGAYALWYKGEERTVLDEFAYTDETSAEALLTELKKRLGDFSVPLPVGGGSFCGQRTRERFNMLKPIQKTDLAAFCVETGAPFDFKKY